jgi:acyl carrier protein
VPIGVVGEIYIGGDGVARGYLNRPELTAEKFIYHSFDGEPARRLYRTGDLARYLPDGNIEFLGRIDTQVKIRDYRIELGEIEAVLSQHPAIREAIAMVREDKPGDKRLVGYLVARSEAAFDAAEVTKYLKRKLPEYMIPSALVLLDELPLTANGKVDRGELPAPDQNRPECEKTFIAPRTPVEEILASIWSEVLKVARVGIHDNFFELGGHSLLATQIVSRIRIAFSIEMPLRHMFESPTVAEMAVEIMALQGNKLGVEELERMLGELESMLDEESEKLVAKETVKG